MQRIHAKDTVPVLPEGPKDGTPGYFSDGNAATGDMATVIDAAWCNGVQEELMAFLTAAGVEPSAEDLGQVLASVKKLTDEAVKKYAAPIGHASKETAYGLGDTDNYGHLKLSDAVDASTLDKSMGTAATPKAVAEAMTEAQGAAETASHAQATADAAQSTADAAEVAAQDATASVNQLEQNVSGQIESLVASNYWQTVNEAVDADNKFGIVGRYHLTEQASGSTHMPAGIAYPAFFLSGSTPDRTVALQIVLSGSEVYIRQAITEDDGATWQGTAWVSITWGPAALDSLGVVKPDGTTVEVAPDGTLSINAALLSTVYKFKGSVDTVEGLPAEAAQGDVYNVTATGVNYAWTGTAWDALSGIEAVDGSPVQGSDNPVSSGGVYSALKNQKSELEDQISQAASGITPDNVTISSNGGKLQVKDVAIGGDTGDLASASGLLGKCKYVPSSNLTFNADTDVFDEAVIYSSGTTLHGTFPMTGWWIVKQYNYLRSSSSRLQVAFYCGGSVKERIYTRYWWNSTGTWSPWVEYITTNGLGDGIKNTNGILSVPEYEGATESEPGTSGLVPPATSAERLNALCGDGTYKEFLPSSGGTLSGPIESPETITTIRSHSETLDVADANVNFRKIFIQLIDKDNKTAAILDANYADTGNSFFGLRLTKPDGTVGNFGLQYSQTNGMYAIVPTPPEALNGDIGASTKWVFNQLAKYLPLAGGNVTGELKIKGNDVATFNTSGHILFPNSTELWVE